MTEIAEFLAAQLGADEKTATGLRQMVRSLSEINDSRSPATRHGTQIYDAAAWALDRVLADIAAKRGLVQLAYRYAADWDKRSGCGHMAEQIAAGECPAVGEMESMDLMRLLAASFADRTGFRPGWRVDA